MPKNRKTREQKLLSDLRKQNISVSQSEAYIGKESFSNNSSISVKKESIKPKLQTAISTSSYAYLAHDLWKTFFLTLCVVTVELLLHFVFIKY